MDEGGWPVFEATVDRSWVAISSFHPDDEVEVVAYDGGELGKSIGFIYLLKMYCKPCR
ncbi:MAG: hypothetical protein IPO03_02075 [Bacteroidetes bacterium]|nr:hypothetical protein [Bacteroidota bacterium]